MVNSEDAVRKKLGIKWVGAKRLVAEAKENLEVVGDPSDREGSIIEEAMEVFEDMTVDEQDEMRIPESAQEPEWKRKAREQAEKRERIWEEEENARRRQAEMDALAEQRIGQDGGSTTVTSVKRVGVPTRVESKKKNPEELYPPGANVKHTTVCCTIL